MRSPIYMAKLQSIKAGLCRPAEKGRIKGMTSYRRLISYIYAYEGKTKGKNIGFAKLESRNGQCKLSVNVKKVYVGGSDLGVYLLSPEKEICLGTIFIRGGTGEFRTSVSIDNVAESGIPMDRCYGLSIHEKEDAWRSYATIWEDEVAQAAEVELAEVTSEKVGDPNEQIHKKIEALEKEIAENESAEADIAVAQTEDKEETAAKPALQEPQFPSAKSSPAPAPMAPAFSGRPEEEEENIFQQPQEEEIILGDPEELRRLEQEEEKSSRSQTLWEGFRKRCPKIQAFDSAGISEVLTIKPQDIGLLPRETWTYGNNSFLLHGYYNYRYLILAKIEDGKRVRYILGVPGHYYSNEKYMASMFGFPHFVLSKKQPAQDGRFGYWYTDIRMENQDG